MRMKAIKDLVQLPDPKLFAELARGMELCLEHATEVWRSASLLAQQKEWRCVPALESLAEEEAAKYLLLLDAARCPRDGRCSKHLYGFNDHLAKGIYAEVSDCNPSTFGELREYIKLELAKYYLDGPNDYDWIFSNEVLRLREEKLYVAYAEMEGDYRWLSPRRFEDLLTPRSTPSVLSIAQALNDVGFTSPRALQVISHIWRPVTLKDDFHASELRDLNRLTLEQLQKADLLEGQRPVVYEHVVREWRFPLHSFELTLRETDISLLRGLRERALQNLNF